MKRVILLLILIIAAGLLVLFPKEKEETNEEVVEEPVIRVFEPQPDIEISSPLTIKGEARGYWFFEATAPVQVIDSEGFIVGEGYIQAEGDWMTEEFVPFTGVLEGMFTIAEREAAEVPHSNDPRAALLLMNHNASGLPEHDRYISIPILFQQ